jgi:hypothetical protein
VNSICSYVLRQVTWDLFITILHKSYKLELYVSLNSGINARPSVYPGGTRDIALKISTVPPKSSF